MGVVFLRVRRNLFGDGFRGFRNVLRFVLLGLFFGVYVRLSRSGLFRVLFILSLNLFGDDRHGDIFARATSADNRTVSIVELDLPVPCIQQAQEKFFTDAETQVAPVWIEFSEDAEQHSVRAFEVEIVRDFGETAELDSVVVLLVFWDAFQVTLKAFSSVFLNAHMVR